jgi:hypothetical protein
MLSLADCTVKANFFRTNNMKNLSTTRPGRLALVNHTDADQFVTMDSAVSDAIMFTYYSATCQTTTGFGDITPTHVVSQLVTSAQLLGGMLYVLLIVSQTGLPHLTLVSIVPVIPLNIDSSSDPTQQ